MDLTNDEIFYNKVIETKSNGAIKEVWVYLSEMSDTPVTKESLRARFRRINDRKLKDAVLMNNVADEEEEKEEALETKAPEEDNFDSKTEERYEFFEDGSIKSIGVSRILALSDEERKTPELMLKAHGFDPELWILEHAINNYWGSPRPKDRGVRQLYQSKITVKPRNQKHQIEIGDITWFFETFDGGEFAKSVIPMSYSKNGKSLQMNVADAHFGNEEKGYPTRQKIYDLVEEVKEKSSDLEFEEILLNNLGDLLHFDNVEGQTSHGTQVGGRGDYYQYWEEALTSLIYAINELKAIAPVKVTSVSGNHDLVSSFSIMKALQYHFSQDEYVIFDVDFEHQKVQEIGDSVFLLVHGDIPKNNIKTILQREARKEYGRTTHAYVLLGHIHHCVVNDEGGVYIMSLPSPTDPDYWHKQQSYGGNWRGTYCFIVDHKKGITDTWHIGTK